MAGLLQKMDSYEILADKRDFFSQYKVEVGSTGNLGLSIWPYERSAWVPRRSAYVGRCQTVEKG